MLQRGVPVRVWGWAHHACKVAAALALSGASPYPLPVAHDGSGYWVATLPPQPGGTAPAVLRFATAVGDAIELTDLVFGEVFACLGQSNMQGFWPGGSVASAVQGERDGGGGGAASADAAAAAASLPLPLRYFGLGAFPAEAVSWAVGEPLEDFPFPPYAPWVDAGTLANAGNLSAVCWFMGRGIAAGLGGTVPVGLIELALGGTYLVHWCSKVTARACRAPEVAADRRFGLPPTGPALRNALLAPLAVGPLALAGAAWYQGESEALGGQEEWYGCGLPLFLEDLRGLLGAPQLWIGLVQLAPFFSDETQLQSIPAVRAVQARVAATTSRVSLVTAVDAGDPGSPSNNLHPRFKRVVGERLAGAALEAAALLQLKASGAAAGALPQLLPWRSPAYGSAAAAVAMAGDASGSGSASSCELLVEVTLDPATLPQGQQLNWVPWSANSVTSKCPLDGFSHFCGWFEVQDAVGVWFNASAAIKKGGRRLQLRAAPPAGVSCGAPGAPQGPAAATRYGWAPWPVVNVALRGVPLLPWPATPLLAALENEVDSAV